MVREKRMNDIVKRLRDGVWGRARRADAVIHAAMHDGADYIEAQAARIAELEAALNQAKQHFVADEPLKAFVEICAALQGGKS